ncbi:hypothetical protein TNIN_58991 [Trichonephila inaurata madagascariensis]|uniref:Uncharacterized protein n=1 Tax=Trichonephila inaurata madagascariensis TaxID=2747483 RepID=A0A8X6X364_9ARAC|nr:hypothetical protein TNIN_58991 [Trichonephila inaurata madagascariensis]
MVYHCHLSRCKFSGSPGLLLMHMGFEAMLPAPCFWKIVTPFGTVMGILAPPCWIVSSDEPPVSTIRFRAITAAYLMNKRDERDFSLLSSQNY